MKIKMKTLYAGPAGVMEAGKTYLVNPDVGLALVQSKFAEEISSPLSVEAEAVPAESAVSQPDEVIETADAPVEPVEQAVRPRARRRS